MIKSATTDNVVRSGIGKRNLAALGQHMEVQVLDKYGYSSPQWSKSLTSGKTLSLVSQHQPRCWRPLVAHPQARAGVAALCVPGGCRDRVARGCCAWLPGWGVQVSSWSWAGKAMPQPRWQPPLLPSNPPETWASTSLSPLPRGPGSSPRPERDRDPEEHSEPKKQTLRQRRSLQRLGDRSHVCEAGMETAEGRKRRWQGGAGGSAWEGAQRAGASGEPSRPPPEACHRDTLSPASPGLLLVRSEMPRGGPWPAVSSPAPQLSALLPLPLFTPVHPRSQPSCWLETLGSGSPRDVGQGLGARGGWADEERAPHLHLASWPPSRAGSLLPQPPPPLP